MSRASFLTRQRRGVARTSRTSLSRLASALLLLSLIGFGCEEDSGSDLGAVDLGPRDQGADVQGDGEVDQGPEDPCEGKPLQRFCRDADGDGHGDPAVAEQRCSSPGEGWVLACDDCDDEDRLISPSEPERCDGVDQDCDRVPDQTFDLGGVCAVGLGACRREGTLQCTEDGAVGCDATPGEPSEERCDGLDDDCNGLVDDAASGCACPEGEVRACGSDVGECRPGEQRCLGERWGDCEGGQGATDERCNGLDDDCDGLIDDREPPCLCLDDEQRSCGSEIGACEPGQQRCVDGAWGGCEGGVSSREERCDGLDDDCDGFTDEDFTLGSACSEGLGRCRAEGVFVCTEDGADVRCDAVPGQAEAESCNGQDDDCDGETDEEGVCEGLCPEDMALIDNSYCMDRYEASRPDATAETAGIDLSRATSRPGVMPWYNLSWEQARDACVAAGKRLCAPDEWFNACRGPEEWLYPYGNDYDPVRCNGIDTFCPGEPYPHCRDDFPGDTRFHRTVTGAFPDCHNGQGVYDLAGNLWEFDADPAGRGRGGAFNCSDSEALHRCAYLAEWGPGPRSNFGFRCCRDRGE